MIIEHKGISVFYTDKGKGKVVVLLHGFLEDHTMWNSISSEIVKTHRVIAMDLLGHGRTDCLSNEHTMDDMAEALHAVLEVLQISNATLIGHSMGGYVALAYAHKYLNKVDGLCLMNSTYEADDDERKELRARANELVRDNFESMVRASFSNLFSEQSRTKYRSEFEEALQIALKTPVQGYIAAQTGMKLREDFTSFYLKASFKKAILLGKKDAVLDSEAISKVAIRHDIQTGVFSEGHMSHIENKTECLYQIVHFIEKI